MIINEETRYIKTYKLEVTEEELAVIHILVSSVGGDPDRTWRGIATNIFKCTKNYFPNFGTNCRSRDGALQATSTAESLVRSCKEHDDF